MHSFDRRSSVSSKDSLENVIVKQYKESLNKGNYSNKYVIANFLFLLCITVLLICNYLNQLEKFG